MFSGICVAEEPAKFQTNLNWKSVIFAGNDFEIREEGLYTKVTTNAVFVRSDKYIDGTKSFTMEYEVDILAVVNDPYVWEQGWLYYIFGMGLPDEAESPYTDDIKNQMFYYGGITIMPQTRDGVYISANTEQALPESLNGGLNHFTIKIEYAAKFQEFAFYMNDELLSLDYYNDQYHEGYLGIETAWTEMLVTKAIYTEYPEGLPSEQFEPTEKPTETPAQTPTPETTATAQATKAPNTDEEKSDSPLMWVIIGIASVAVITVAVIVVRKKRK